MPREESIAESAKQRSLRVPLDHYEQPERLVRAKRKLSVVAALVGAAYVGWLLVGGRAAQVQTSPGRLAAAHATWNDDCLACHKSFEPLRSDAVSLAALFGGKEAHRQSLDEGCVKCHNTPVHHAAAKAEEVPSCAACHRDHRGLSADIVRPTDSMCLECHKAIELHRTGPSAMSPQTARISGFGPAPAGGQGPHPDFRSLQSDPGNVKFNHWLHLQPGIAVGDAKQKLKLSDLEENRRAQYAAYGKADGLVQLDCAACHRPDPNGASMKPLAFEEHCRACHRLELKNGAAVAEIPHGLSADRLTTVVGGLLLAGEQKQNELPATPDESGARPLIPGRTLGHNLAQKITADVLGRRSSATRAVTAKCLECHYARDASPAGGGDISDVAPADLPKMWLRHGRFDHAAHRHVECRNCHAAAYAYEQHDKPQFVSPREGAAVARDDQQVMIAGLENCAVCHAPARGGAGGARYDCAECHRYHGRDAAFGGQSSADSRGQRTGDRGPGSGRGQRISLASFSRAVESTSPYVGAWSCASSGCHGEVRSSGPEWKSAFTVWATVDPHAQAFEVLWTFRGREMTRLLARREETLPDAEHLAVLERRCVGCHVTPGPHGGKSAEATALGVSCESCHGPAGEWLHAHYRAGFQRDTAGFIDTRDDLNQRAATCMKCHVGPSEETGVAQVVDHDLIAAGHPRLAFEFHSYFESKPAHWNRKSLEALQPGDFHFRSWLAGQAEQHDQRQKLLPEAGVADFSQLDCTSCHHALAANSWRQKLQTEILKVPSWPGDQLPAASSSVPVTQRLHLLGQLLLRLEQHASWDEAVQFYLALRAVMGDFGGTNSSANEEMIGVRSAANALGSYLGKDCFLAVVQENRQPTPYDSPTNFTPDSLNSRLRSVQGALQKLESQLATP